MLKHDPSHDLPENSRAVARLQNFCEKRLAFLDFFSEVFRVQADVSI